MLYAVCTLIFQSSVKVLVKKRMANLKKNKASKKKKSEETVVVETGQQSTEKDFEKNEKELIKELGRKVVNWKAVQQLQMLTFAKRWEKIKSITGKNAVEKIREAFPYLDNQTMVTTIYNYVTLHLI